MKLKRNVLFSLCVVTAIGFTAQAAADSFVGPGIGIGLGVASTNMDYSGYISGSTDETDFAGELNFSWGVPVAGDFLITAGGTWGINKLDMGTGNYYNSYGHVESKVKNRFFIWAAPGYRLTPDIYLYAKGGYYWAKGEYQESRFGSGDASIHGYGVGIGAAFTPFRVKDIELGAEVLYADFSDKTIDETTVSPDWTQFMLTVTYRF